MSNVVIPFRGITKLDLDPDVILDDLKGQVQGFVLMGWTAEGEEFFSSTYADGGTVLWLMERCKRKLLADTEDTCC